MTKSRGRGRDADSPSPSSPPEPPAHFTGHRDRLRQRFLAAPDSLADYELLEMLLFIAIPRRDVKPLAKRLIDQFGTLGGVLTADPEQLRRRANLSETTVAALKTVPAAARRMLKEEVERGAILNTWKQLLQYLSLAMKYEKIEHFRLLFLDRKNVLIADEVQQSGTVDHTPVYPREVAKRALELHACAVIMVHNHPSGDPTPSQGDINTTREVAKALTTVGVTLRDHLIIGRSDHVSLKQLALF